MDLVAILRWSHRSSHLALGTPLAAVPVGRMRKFMMVVSAHRRVEKARTAYLDPVR